MSASKKIKSSAFQEEVEQVMKLPIRYLGAHRLVCGMTQPKFTILCVPINRGPNFLSSYSTALLIYVACFLQVIFPLLHFWTSCWSMNLRENCSNAESCAAARLCEKGHRYLPSFCSSSLSCPKGGSRRLGASANQVFIGQTEIYILLEGV